MVNLRFDGSAATHVDWVSIPPASPLRAERREAERVRQELWEREAQMARARQQFAQEQWEDGYF